MCKFDEVSGELRTAQQYILRKRASFRRYLYGSEIAESLSFDTVPDGVSKRRANIQ